jgi:hypothetical protein
MLHRRTANVLFWLERLLVEEMASGISATATA